MLASFRTNSPRRLTAQVRVHETGAPIRSDARGARAGRFAHECEARRARPEFRRTQHVARASGASEGARLAMLADEAPRAVKLEEAADYVRVARAEDEPARNRLGRQRRARATAPPPPVIPNTRALRAHALGLLPKQPAGCLPLSFGPCCARPVPSSAQPSARPRPRGRTRYINFSRQHGAVEQAGGELKRMHLFRCCSGRIAEHGRTLGQVMASNAARRPARSPPAPAPSHHEESGEQLQ